MSSTRFSSAGRAVPHAHRMTRWGVRLVLALLLLLPVGACAALVASSWGPPPTVTEACPHGGPGHEVLCEVASSVAAAAQRQWPRDWWTPAVAAGLAVLAFGLLAPRALAWISQGPRRARREAPTGRHLLLSVGITRV